MLAVVNPTRIETIGQHLPRCKFGSSSIMMLLFQTHYTTINLGLINYYDIANMTAVIEVRVTARKHSKSE